MFVDSTGNQRAAVVGAIRNAAQATGANFQYLLATAQVESGLNPNASVSSTSAKGLFQFIDQTWLTTLKEAGPALGYGRYAAAIVQLPDGRYTVPDAAMRREIMALRDDPGASAAMAGAFTQQNAALLAQKIGRNPTEGELYVAHFLGAAGGAQLINLASQNPNTTAASVFPNAAKANPTIFYDRNGNARSAESVYRVLVSRYDVARASPVVPANTLAPAAGHAVATGRATTQVHAAATQVQAAAATTTVLTAAAAANTTATQTTPATANRPQFHSLFSDGQPVSRFVQDLWTTSPRTAAALTGLAVPPGTATATNSTAATATGNNNAAPQTETNGPLGLFSDQPSNVRALFGERS